MVELFLVRHGETQENLDGILQGHLPGCLTANGVRQAETLRQELAGERFDVLLVSDLARTVATARVLNEAFGLPLVTTSLLRERDWGSLTGCRIAEARRAPFPPDVEGVEAMAERARAFLSFVCGHYDGCRVLAVGHGLFNRCILSILTGRPIAEIPRWGNAEARRVVVTHLPDGSFRPTEAGASAD